MIGSESTPIAANANVRAAASSSALTAAAPALASESAAAAVDCAGCGGGVPLGTGIGEDGVDARTGASESLIGASEDPPPPLITPPAVADGEGGTKNGVEEVRSTE